jgi:CHAT domain-containing protein
MDGLLFAIEACDLNLNGTELVVLSACETARGWIDYGEGISGLVRGFRVAGARNVLVTTRPVSDERTADFMQVFYWFLLDDAEKSPAAALRETQRYYLRPNSRLVNDPTWEDFMLIGAA